MQQKSKWTILFLIWLMMLIAYCDRIAIAVAGPSLSASLGLSKTEFGWALSAFTFGYALMQVPGGYLSDRHGARPLLVAALLAWSLFTVFTGAVTSLVTLLAVRVLFGFGEGAENGAQFKLIGDYFPTRERARANSLFLTSLALGPALATWLCAVLIQRFGWREMFFIFSVPGFLLAGVLFLTLPRHSPPNPEGADQPNESEGLSLAALGKAIRLPAARLSAGAYFFFNVTFWGFLSWTPTYLTGQRHIALSKMGFEGALPYLAGFVGLVVIGQLGTGRLLNHRGALASVCVLAAAGFLYLAMVATQVSGCIGWLSASAFFLYGMFGPFWALAVGMAPTASRGAFTGFVSFCGQCGAFGGQILIGYLADQMRTFDGAILVMVASSCIAAAFLASLERRRTAL